MTVARKPGHRGEHEISRKTIAQGMPGCPGEPVVTTLVCFLLAREAAGAAGTRHSLCPLLSRERPYITRARRAARWRTCILLDCLKIESEVAGRFRRFFTLPWRGRVAAKRRGGVTVFRFE